jgi:outer membrane protein
MYKKIVLFALMLLPLTAFAQEVQKIAHVNYGEIILAMPEYTQMQDSLKKSEAALLAELQVMRDDYNSFLQALVEQQNTLVESIKVRRQQELSEKEERIGNFQQYAQGIQGQLSQALFTPIQEKFQKAVSDVATENHYTYVLNFTPEQNILLYVSPKGIDATPLVKAKLGLK